MRGPCGQYHSTDFVASWSASSLIHISGWSGPDGKCHDSVQRDLWIWPPITSCHAEYSSLQLYGFCEHWAELCAELRDDKSSRFHGQRRHRSSLHAREVRAGV